MTPQQRAAALAICARADGPADAAHLLEAVGLTPYVGHDNRPRGWSGLVAVQRTPEDWASPPDAGLLPDPSRLGRGQS